MERAGFCFVDCLAVARIMQKVSFSSFWLLKTCFNMLVFQQSYSNIYRDLQEADCRSTTGEVESFLARQIFSAKEDAASRPVRGYARRAQRGILLNSLRLQVCISLMQICGAHYKEPAKAAGIPFARGASRCKAMELVLPSLTDRGCGACASNERADGATCRKRP